MFGIDDVVKGEYLDHVGGRDQQLGFSIGAELIAEVCILQGSRDRCEIMAMIWKKGTGELLLKAARRNWIVL